MKVARSIALCIVLISLVSCEDPLIKAAKDAVRYDAKDPESVQFRNVHACAKPNAVYGEYNAKNSYGAYVGFRPFIYAGAQVWTAGEAAGYEAISKLCYSDAVLAETAKEMAKFDVPVENIPPTSSPSPDSATIAPISELPVTVQGGELGGCLNGEVKGLLVDGDGYLAVRVAPDVRATEIDRIHNDQAVFMCATRGKWTGIVYSSEPDDCGLDHMPKAPAPYSGKCSSGWVSTKWVQRFAD